MLALSGGLRNFLKSHFRLPFSNCLPSPYGIPLANS